MKELFRQVIACVQGDLLLKRCLLAMCISGLIGMVWPPAMLIYTPLSIALLVLLPKRFIAFLRDNANEEIASYATRLQKSIVVGVDGDPTTFVLLLLLIIFMICKLGDLVYGAASHSFEMWAYPLFSLASALLLYGAILRAAVVKAVKGSL